MSGERCQTCLFLPCRCDDLRELAAGSEMGRSCTSACWPMVSDALAVHPKQVQQARERAKRHGINVEYKSNGQVVIPDRAERRRLLRLEGFHDNSGGYGD
jgi:hypothetical protein